MERLRVSLPESDDGFERFNIAPTDQVLAAVKDEHGRRIERLRWGLLPGRAAEKPRFPMINARAETVRSRPAFRHLVEDAGHRCLVVADGWYEWQRPEDPKQPREPVHFSLPGREPFYFAGLWTRRTSSCTIITCPANDLSRPIHDRMPVVLEEPAAWETWLDPVLDGSAVCELLVPLSSERLRVRPANPLVNSVANDGPGCLEPDLTLL